MVSQTPANLEPILIHKIWTIFPLFLPTVHSIISVTLSLVLLSIISNVNSSMSSENAGPIMAIAVVGVVFNATYILTSLGSLITIIYRYLAIKTFKLFIGNDHLIIQSGILNKSERTIPFNVIQNVILSHSLTDYFFDLASIQIENASNSGMVLSTSGSSNMALGNMVSIPCLSANLALNVRNQLLEKVKIFNHLSPSQGI